MSVSSPEVPLRSFPADPEALSRLTVLCAVFGVEYGESQREREELLLGFFDDQIVLSMDLGAGRRGDAQPMRVRMALPSTKPAEASSGSAPLVLRIRAHDLVTALRNTISNSESMGVLNSCHGVTLDVLEGEAGQPSLLRVRPGAEARKSPRDVPVLGAEVLPEGTAVQVPMSSNQVEGLDARVLLDLAHAAVPGVGVLLEPGPGGQLAAATGGSVLVAPLPEARFRSHPQDSMVMPPRFAAAAAIAQQALGNALVVQERSRTQAEARAVQEAALIALLDVRGDQGVHAVAETVGGTSAKKLLARLARQPEESRLTAYLKLMEKALPTDQDGRMTILASLSPEELAPFMRQARAEVLALPVGDSYDELLVSLGAAYTASRDSLDALAQCTARSLGMTAIHAYEQSLDAGTYSGSAVPRTMRSRANAAIDILPRSGSRRVIADLTNQLSDEQYAVWLSHFRDRMSQLQVSSAARDSIASECEGRPLEPNKLKLPPRIPEERYSEARREVEGRIWKGASSEACVGVGRMNPSIGVVHVSDGSSCLEPSEYPWGGEDLRALRGREGDGLLSGVVGVTQFQDAVGRIGALSALSGRPEDDVPHAFLGWSPTGSPFRIPSESVDAVSFGSRSFERTDRERGSSSLAHTLQVVGIQGKSKDTVALHLPAELGTYAEGEDLGRDRRVVAVMDGAELSRAMAYASPSGSQLGFAVREGLMVLSEPISGRTAVIPGTRIESVDERLRELLGVATDDSPDLGRNVALQAVCAFAEDLRRGQLKAAAGGHGTAEPETSERSDSSILLTGLEPAEDRFPAILRPTGTGYERVERAFETSRRELAGRLDAQLGLFDNLEEEAAKEDRHVSYKSPSGRSTVVVR